MSDCPMRGQECLYESEKVLFIRKCGKGQCLVVRANGFIRQVSLRGISWSENENTGTNTPPKT